MFNKNGGQVYVRVEADDSMPMMFSNGGGAEIGGSGEGGGGQTHLGVIISWKFDGGITATHGWTLKGKTIIPVDGDIEATNKRVSEAAKGMNFLDIMAIGECVIMM